MTVWAQEQYIPPTGVHFRLIGFASKCAIFSRTHAQPQVGHYTISAGSYPDQWFTLVEGTGDRKGTYMIKGRATNFSLFSRRHAEPYVGHISPADGAGKYADNWFALEPGTGKRSGYFRLITPALNLAIVSRTHASPQFINHPANDIYDDHYFSFIFEEMEVEKIEYDLKLGQVVTSMSEEVQDDQNLHNGTDQTRDFDVNIQSTQQHALSWDYGFGFPLPTSTILKGGVPRLQGSEFVVDTSIKQAFKFGEPNSYSKTYTASLSVEIDPGKTVRADAAMYRGQLEVPYTIYLKSKSSGAQTTTTGMWRGDTWDLRYSTTDE